MRLIGLLLCIGLFTATECHAANPAPATRPALAAIALRDVDGNACKPLAMGDAKAAVVLFVGHQCPISNGYSPEINRIVAEYGAKGVRFYLAHVDPDLSTEDAKAHAADFGYKAPVLLDGKRVLAHALGAKVTPEAFLVGPDGKVRYQGRIDDKWYDFGRSRAEPTVRDLRLALDAVLAGKEVANPRTESLGCPIE